MNGDKYVGEVKNGKFDGRGQYFDSKTGEIFDGEFKNGLRHGKITVIKPDGKILETVWINGNP